MSHDSMCKKAAAPASSQAVSNPIPKRIQNVNLIPKEKKRIGVPGQMALSRSEEL